MQLLTKLLLALTPSRNTPRRGKPRSPARTSPSEARRESPKADGDVIIKGQKVLEN
jgi:hypothetical protein